MGNLLPFTWLLVLSVFAGPVHADLFYLNSGGRVEGELLNPNESPRQAYIVDTDSGKVTLKTNQVERVILKSDAEKSYDKFVASLPDTPEAHWDTAERCDKAGLKKQREFHLEQVIRLDPNHEKARHALGYSRVDGQWARADELMKQRGYIRYGNAWRLPQEIEAEVAAKAQEKQTVEWRRNLNRWKGWIKYPERELDGQNEILRIRDPLATEALIESLVRDKEQKVRLLYIEPLAEIGGADALHTFIEIVLKDRDSKVRERCLEKLEKAGSKGVVRQFIKALKHEDNLIVNRAAAALGELKDPEATPALIEALVTEHKQLVGSGGISPTFTGDGGGGMTMGGGPKVVKIPKQNEAALRALSIMHPGTNFGFNQATWRAWYVEINKPRVNVNLRRGA